MRAKFVSENEDYGMSYDQWNTWQDDLDKHAEASDRYQKYRLEKLRKQDDEEPRESLDEFINWLEKLFIEHEDEPWEGILGVLINDENSDNEELADYLETEIGADKMLVNQLIEKREYFLDFRYSQHIHYN